MLVYRSCCQRFIDLVVIYIYIYIYIYTFDRRNAKAALTRAGKSLRHLIESTRPGKEVRDVFSKVQEAYEKLIEKHEEFTKLIEDEKEFEEQEAWLEESQYMFLRLETDTKLYLESTEALP